MSRKPIDDDGYMSVGEVARELGVSQQSLRDWRRRGFLDGMGRRSGGWWLYSHEEVSIIREALLVARLPSLGLAIRMVRSGMDAKSIIEMKKAS